MTRDEHIDAVIAAYNKLGTEVYPNEGTPRRPATRQEHGRAIGKFVDWCIDIGADPERFTYARVYFSMEEQATHRGFPLPTALRSPAIEDSWTDLYDWFERLLQAKKMRAILDKQDAAQRLSEINRKPVRERLKASYAEHGKRAICMEMTPHTGGFHPYSESCTSCTLITPCLIRTNAHYGYDVVDTRHTEKADA